MEASLRRLCVCLVCLFPAGCLQVPYCLPEVSYVPSVNAKCKGADVVCFRVDVTQKMEIKESKAAMLGEVVDRVELTQIQPSAQGATSPQVGVSLATGWRYVGAWNFTTTSTGHAITLRFYRPGYDTIVLKPGESPGELKWTEANDLLDEAKAIDDLMNFAPAKSTRTSAIVRHELEPGTKSASHRKALLFGASEYERLAGTISAQGARESELQGELVGKANRLRALVKGT